MPLHGALPSAPFLSNSLPLEWIHQTIFCERPDQRSVRIIFPLCCAAWPLSVGQTAGTRYPCGMVMHLGTLCIASPDAENSAYAASRKHLKNCSLAISCLLDTTVRTYFCWHKTTPLEQSKTTERWLFIALPCTHKHSVTSRQSSWKLTFAETSGASWSIL